MSRKSLFHAARTGDVSFIEEAKGTLSGGRDARGRNALMEAARVGNVEVVRALASTEQGQQTPEGFTALMLGCAMGQHDIVGELQAEYGMQSQNGTTALMCAAGSGSIACVKALLEKEAGFQTAGGITAAMLAAAQGYVDIVQLLQAELDIKDADGRTVLMHAAGNGQFKCVEYLLSNASKLVGLMDNEGKSALRHAFDGADEASRLPEERRLPAFTGLKQCIMVLVGKEGYLTACDRKTTLMLYCLNKLLPPSELVQRQMRQQTTEGMTALMYACRVGFAAAIQLLTDELNQRDSRGATASMIAAENNNYACLRLVLPAEYQTRDNAGATVMHYAARGGDRSMLKELQGVFSKQTDSYGNPALFYAIKARNLNGIQELLKESAMVNAAGETALMVAAQADFPEAVRIFSRLAASVDAAGKTALAHAVENDSAKVFLQLLETEGLGKRTQESLLQAAMHNSFRVAKLVIDAARKNSSIAAPGVEISAVQRGLCQKLIIVRSGKNTPTQTLFQGITPGKDGFDALELAILANASETVQVLAEYYRQLPTANITPLMLAVQKDGLSIDALGALAKAFGGMGLKETKGVAPGLTVGTTALMISCMHNNVSTEVVRLLAMYEKDAVDGKGMRAIDYARIAGRDDLVLILKFYVLTVDGLNRIKEKLSAASPGSVDLDLWHCSLQDQQLFELQPFFGKLRSLDIGDNATLGAQAVSGFCQLLKDPFNAPRGLESLCLSRLPISDAAVVALSEGLKSRSTSLKELYLRDCGLTDAQLCVLLQGVQNQLPEYQLGLLNCRQNKLTGRAAKAVSEAEFKAPIRIDLRQNPIPEAVLERLQTVLRQRDVYGGYLELQTDVFSTKATLQPPVITAPPPQLFQQVFKPEMHEREVLNTCIPQHGESCLQNTALQDSAALPRQPAIINPIGISVTTVAPQADPLQGLAMRFEHQTLQPAAQFDGDRHRQLPGGVSPQADAQESLEARKRRARQNIFRQTEPRPVGPILQNNQQLPNLWLERNVQRIEGKAEAKRDPPASVSAYPVQDVARSEYYPAQEIVAARQAPPVPRQQDYSRREQQYDLQEKGVSTASLVQQSNQQYSQKVPDVQAVVPPTTNAIATMNSIVVPHASMESGSSVGGIGGAYAQQSVPSVAKIDQSTVPANSFQQVVSNQVPAQAELGVDLSALFTSYKAAGKAEPLLPIQKPSEVEKSKAAAAEQQTMLKQIDELSKQVDALQEDIQLKFEEDEIFQHSFVQLRPLLAQQGFKMNEHSSFKEQILQLLSDIAFGNKKVEQ